jgi:hypothetical protein
METTTNKEKVEELKNTQLRVFKKISINADARLKEFIESFEKFLIPIFDESFQEVEPFELEYLIKKLQQLETELDKNLPQKCWCYSVKHDADDTILCLETYQAEIKEIKEFQGEKNYLTSQGIYHEHNIAFTEIDICKKALSRFQRMQKDAMCLIEQAEAKLKELEQQKTE